MGASNKAGGRLTTDAGWQLPFASFVNPTYIGPPDRNTGVVPSTGVALGSSAGLIIQFSGTYAGITLVHEQTLDPDGATGWFPVAGQVISGAPGTPGSGLAATGSAYCFPSFGALHRIRVTAMASGTVVVFAGLIYDVYDVSTAGGGGGGGGGDVNITAVGGNPVTTSVPVSGTFWQATQPVSAASLPLPAGAATLTGQTAVQGTFGAVTAERAVIYDSAGAALDYTAPALTEGPAVAGTAVGTFKPTLSGGRGSTANPTAVTDGQLQRLMLDKVGRTATVPHQIRDLCTDTAITITSTTTAADLIAAVASTFVDIVSITMVNTSATGTVVQILNADGTTVRWTGYCPPTDMRGIVLPVPLKGAALNAKWMAKTVTSVSAVTITVQYVLNT